MSPDQIDRLLDLAPMALQDAVAHVMEESDKALRARALDDLVNAVRRHDNWTIRMLFDTLCQERFWNCGSAARRVSSAEDTLFVHLTIDEIVALLNARPRPTPLFVRRCPVSDLTMSTHMEGRHRRTTIATLLRAGNTPFEIIAWGRAHRRWDGPEVMVTLSDSPLLRQLPDPPPSEDGPLPDTAQGGSAYDRSKRHRTPRARRPPPPKPKRRPGLRKRED